MKRLTTGALLFLLIAGCRNNEEELVRKAEKIHETILSVDTHCDTPINIVKTGYDLGKRNTEGCVDFPRMMEGGLDAEFFAVFIPQGQRDDSTLKMVYSQTIEIFDAIHENVNRYPSMAGLAFSPEEGERLKKDKKIAAFIGLENGYAIGRDISKIKKYYDLGARYITLCHSSNNDICDSSTDPAGPEHGGLSEFGEEVVKEMNRIGMMVDVSHISDEAFYDVVNLSEVPVIASHSSCRSLCSSPRNMTDDMLLALKENGGVIQICILSSYIKTPEPNPEMDAKLEEIRTRYGDPKLLTEEKLISMRAERREIINKYRKLATVSDVVDHIDHVVQVIGIDHIGIGTDFDGGGEVDGCRSVAEMKNITVELLRRDYSKEEIAKIWGENFMRVFREVEQYPGKR